MSSPTLAALDDLAYCVPIQVTFDPFRDPPVVPLRRHDVDSKKNLAALQSFQIGSQA